MRIPRSRVTVAVVAAAATVGLLATGATAAVNAASPDGGAGTADAGAADAGAADERALVWSDEFEGAAGTAPDPANWNHETGGGGWGNGELQTYTDSRDNSALDGNGNLVITARQDGSGGYTSARMTTKGKVEPQFGRVEARIKIPRGQGIWPAFWSLGSGFPDTPWPNSGEIDIMENVGYEPHIVHGTLHGPGYSGGGGIGAGYTHPEGWSFADDFHTFAIDWSQDKIEWSVDGTVYQTRTPADVPGEWVYNQPFFLILNVAVGGAWPGNPDGTTQFPQEMVVDYVRVYDGAAG